jgi:hypothetical protein
MKLLREYSPNKSTKFSFYLKEDKQGKYIGIHEYILIQDERRPCKKPYEMIVNTCILPAKLLSEVIKDIEI